MKQGKFLMISAFIWTGLFVLMVAGMLYYNYGYAKTPDEVSSYISENQNEKMISDSNQSDYEMFSIKKSIDGTSHIALPDGLTIEEVSVKNDYLNHCIILSVTNPNKSFYQKNVDFFIGEQIQKVYYYRNNEQDIFVISLKELYECSFSIESKEICLAFSNFNDLYEKVVLVDFETNSIETSKSAIDICQNVLSDTDQKIIFMNHNEMGNSLSKIQQLIKEAGVDFYIEITTGQVDELETSGMYAYYQEKYYVNGFGSIELADALERQIVSSVSGTANGLLPATEQMDTIIFAGTVSACIYVGSYGNPEEAVMLDSELFWEKLSNGLELVFSEAFGN